MKLAKKVRRILTPRQRHLFVVLFFMMLVGAALETVGTGLILPLITAATSPDAVLGNKHMRAVYEFFHLTSVNQFLMLCVILLIAIFVLKNVYLYFMYYAQYRFVYNGSYNASRALFKEYINRPYEFFLTADTSVAIRNIVSCVNGSYQLVLTILKLLTEVTVFVALFALSVAVSPVMTLVMSAFIALILLFNQKKLVPLQQDYGHKVNETGAKVTKWLLQALDGMKDTKVLNREDYFIDRYNENAKELNEVQRRQNSLSNVPRLSVETILICVILIMLGIFLSRDTSFGIGSQIGQIGVLAVVAVRIMPSANRIVSALGDIAYYEPNVDFVGDYIVHAHEMNMDALYEANQPEEKVIPIPFHKEVAFRDITFRYENTDIDIFSHANLTIPIGQSIGIIGPSGAGKSTAVDLILGLLRPQQGAILVDGTNIEENLPGWYADIGYVPQMMFMLDDTVRANVAYGVDRDKVDDEKVWAVLKEAQLDEYVRGLPQGLDTGIGERGIRISGGQRQRIGIARALYNDPDIMIFDEATSALDNDTEAAIMEAIERLHGKKTLVIVAHRLTTIEHCDHVYQVENKNFVQLR